MCVPGVCCVLCVAGGEAVVTGSGVVIVPWVTVSVDVTDTGGDTVRETVSVMMGDSIPDTVATAPAVTVTFVV
jgi:hypothetical protein